jgi:predicted nucleotidyltransferase
MGTMRAEGSPGLADALFTPVQQRVLGLLFGQPSRRFQSAELIRLAGSGTGAAHRLMKRLESTGLVRVSTEGHQKYYQANPESAVFEDLTRLVRKTVGLGTPLRESLSPFAERIRAAFVYGSVAAGSDRADSDIDLAVVADGLDYPTLYEALQDAERQLGRRIDLTVVTTKEWRRKRAMPDGFAARILGKPHLLLIGSDDDLR